MTERAYWFCTLSPRHAHRLIACAIVPICTPREDAHDNARLANILNAPPQVPFGSALMHLLDTICFQPPDAATVALPPAPTGIVFLII
jgi:hypothetical protein